MAASGALAPGTNTYYSTISTSNTAELVSFADRFNYVTVTNMAPAGAPVLYVRTDGQAATGTTGETNSYVVPPGQSRMIANGAGMWFQSSNVIPHGVLVNSFGPVSPANPSTPTQPGTAVPMEAEEGGMANPGTKITLMASFTGTAPSVAPPYAVEAAG